MSTTEDRPERTTAELAAKAHGAWDATFGCPVQVIFGPDDITDCTFRRGHDGSHSWAAPADEAVTGCTCGTGDECPLHCDPAVLEPSEAVTAK